MTLCGSETLCFCLFVCVHVCVRACMCELVHAFCADQFVSQCTCPVPNTFRLVASTFNSLFISNLQGPLIFKEMTCVGYWQTMWLQRNLNSKLHYINQAVCITCR